jgi:hypothetical protein
MKAIVICLGCGDQVSKDCGACVEVGSLWHVCDQDGEPKLFENIEWKIISEN